MKLPSSMWGSTLLCTTLVSTFCLVLCFEVDGPEPQQQQQLQQLQQQQRLPSSLKENVDHSPWIPLSDRAALKELYEMYRDGEAPIWKRAPAAGFFGMRGKKIPGQNFYGMRGKKGPSGFLGMRGKKRMMMMGGGGGESKLARFESSSPLFDADALGDVWTSKELDGGSDEGRQNLLHSHQLLLGDYLPIDQQQQQQQQHVDDKRAPANGFMGLRGKRHVSPKDPASQAIKTSGH